MVLTTQLYSEITQFKLCCAINWFDGVVLRASRELIKWVRRFAQGRPSYIFWSPGRWSCCQIKQGWTHCDHEFNWVTELTGHEADLHYLCSDVSQSRTRALRCFVLFCIFTTAALCLKETGEERLEKKTGD